METIAAPAILFGRGPEPTTVHSRLVHGIMDFSVVSVKPAAVIPPVTTKTF